MLCRSKLEVSVSFIPALYIAEDMRARSQHGRHRMTDMRLHFLGTLDQTIDTLLCVWSNAAYIMLIWIPKMSQEFTCLHVRH